MVPPLVALWANLHGAFPAGIILVGCFTVASVCRWPLANRRHTFNLSISVLACVLASLVNPYGWEIYRYVGGTSAIAYQRGIAEWAPPSPDRLIGLMWMTSVVLVLGLFLWRWLRTRIAPLLRDALILGCFLLLSAGSIRMAAWWFLAIAPILAELLVWTAPKLAVQQEDDHRPSPMAGGVFALVVLAVVFCLPGLDQFNPLLGPTRRGQRIEEDLESVHRHMLTTPTAASGNIYSHFEWGEYLSWSVAPRPASSWTAASRSIRRPSGTNT